MSDLEYDVIVEPRTYTVDVEPRVYQVSVESRGLQGTVTAASLLLALQGADSETIDAIKLALGI